MWSEPITAQPGERVIFRDKYTRKYTFMNVARVTKTQVILENGWRFVRRSGERCGESHNWRSDSIYNASPNNLREMDQENDDRDIEEARRLLRDVINKLRLLGLDSWGELIRLAEALPREDVEASEPLVALLKQHGWTREVKYEGGDNSLVANQ